MDNIVLRLNIGETATRVGLVRYANVGDSIFYLDTSYELNAIRSEILNLVYVDGNTNTSGGIRVMHFDQFLQNRGDRANVQNIAIIITDGVSTWDKDRTIPDAVDARNDGIRIFSVGITDAVDENELRLMSSSPQIEGQNYWRSSDFSQLDNIVAEIVQQTCTSISSGSIP